MTVMVMSHHFGPGTSPPLDSHFWWNLSLQVLEQKGQCFFLCLPIWRCLIGLSLSLSLSHRVCSQFGGGGGGGGSGRREKGEKYSYEWNNTFLPLLQKIGCPFRFGTFRTHPRTCATLSKTDLDCTVHVIWQYNKIINVNKCVSRVRNK